MSEPAAPPSPLEPERFGRRSLLVLAILALAHAAFVASTWSEAYIDFGDGNYLYIASRIVDGVVPYRDILAPQPPAHLYLGAAVVAVSRFLGMETPILAARAASLVIHLLTFALVADLARLARGRLAGVAAGAIFLALPLSTWWSMGWQSEPLELLFLAAMARLALVGSPRADVAASLAGGMAGLTNATAAPFLLALLACVLLLEPRRALRLAGPAALLAIATIALMEIVADGMFLKTVVLDQTGTVPPGRFVEYAAGKIRREGADILHLEKGFILAAAFGIPSFFRERGPGAGAIARNDRIALGTLLVATMFSFLYVSKGGTVDYIFSLAGPAVAIFGGSAVAVSVGSARESWKIERAREAAREAGTPIPARPRSLRHAGGLFAVTFIFLTNGTWDSARFHVRLWNQSAFELPDLPPDRVETPDGRRPNVGDVKRLIETHSRPGDAILAPPFYAVLTGRRIYGEYSEIFIWTIKDHHDRLARNPSGAGWRKSIELAGAIREGRIPLVILETGQTGRIPEIDLAVRVACVPLLAEPYPTLNTRLGIHVPRGAAPAPEPAR